MYNTIQMYILIVFTSKYHTEQICLVSNLFRTSLHAGFWQFLTLHMHAGVQYMHAGVQYMHAGVQYMHAGVQYMHAGIQYMHAGVQYTPAAFARNNPALGVAFTCYKLNAGTWNCRKSSPNHILGLIIFYLLPTLYLMVRQWCANGTAAPVTPSPGNVTPKHLLLTVASPAHCGPFQTCHIRLDWHLQVDVGHSTIQPADKIFYLFKRVISSNTTK